MENSFQTSFIPKKPITSDRPIAKTPKSLFSILSFVLLLVTLVIAGGLFFYKSYLIKQKESFSVSLDKMRNNFDQDTIKDLENFDKRVTTSKTVLNNHIVLSPMFQLIGDLTIPSVQYTKFEHSNSEGEFQVHMTGVANDYRSVALQADVFNTPKARYFKNVVFSNLSKDKNNYVTFDIEFLVDPVLLSYEKNSLLNDNNASPNNSIDTNLNNQTQ